MIGLIKHRRCWLLAAAIAVACYFLVPKLIWVWRQWQTLDRATAAAAPILGQKIEWATTDLDGAPHSLAEYRGKVVVLDFWYAGCGHCLDAIPKLIGVADEFKTKPVILLGVNTDQGADEERRGRVLNYLKENHFNMYASLHSEHEGARLHEQYRVTLWPTVVVLDQQGTARFVHCGNVPWLESSLTSEIGELLSEEREP